MTSPLFSTRASRILMSFAYHLYENNDYGYGLWDDMGDLELQYFDGAGWMGYWSVSGSQGDAWYLAQVLLPPEVVAVRFLGTTRGGRSDMAIDDINLVSFSVSVSIVDLSCNFETDSCWWPLASSSIGSAWERVAGSSTSALPVAHAGDWYLRAASNSSQDVVLESVPDMVITDKLVAFSFGFQISGSEATTLQLDCQASENSSWLSLWTQYGSQSSSSWQEAIVVVPIGTARLRLLARLAAPRDFACVDSLQLLNVSTTVMNASCDFVVDACGWKSESEAGFKVLETTVFASYQEKLVPGQDWAVVNAFSGYIQSSISTDSTATFEVRLWQHVLTQLSRGHAKK